MRTEGERRSENIEDRRGMGPRVAVGGGLGVVVVALLYTLLGGDPSSLGPILGGGGSPGSGRAAPASPEEERLEDFVAVVLADTEDVWRERFQAMGRRYADPTLVLFRGSVDSACGFASAAVGPFYCPGDQKVYLDLGFFETLGRSLGAPGDFAQAYVIAHEVGHHVQRLVGTSDRVDALRRRADRVEANRLSVRLELQADFLAGVWAHHAQRTRRVLEPGDLEEAIRAAGRIGDDTLQREARGRVVPDSFTHGTSAQRVAWFRRGFESGDVSLGDTFDDRVFESVGAR